MFVFPTVQESWHCPPCFLSAKPSNTNMGWKLNICLFIITTESMSSWLSTHFLFYISPLGISAFIFHICSEGWICTCVVAVIIPLLHSLTFSWTKSYFPAHVASFLCCLWKQAPLWAGGRVAASKSYVCTVLWVAVSWWAQRFLASTLEWTFSQPSTLIAKWRGEKKGPSTKI